MSKRKRPHQMPASERPSQSDLLFRMAQIVRDDIDRENRSFPIVLATETPVTTYDTSRMEMVEEVLRLDGMEVPNQIPMVDSHARGSVVSVLGSIRDFQISDGRLIGRAYFASDPVSRETFEKYADGHLTDFSVGAGTLERVYEGRTKYVTRSKLIEGSAVVVGADRNAKAMVALRAYREPNELREEIMDAKLKELLVKRGLADDASDKEILEFVERELSKDEPGITAKDALDVVRALKNTPNKPDESNADKDAITRAQQQVQEAVAKLERYKTVDEMCRQYGVNDSVRRELIDSDKDANGIAAEILKRKFTVGNKTAVGPGARIEGGLSEREKFYDAARHGILQRALGPIDRLPESVKEEVGQAPQGAKEFAFKRIPDLAREFCERAGERVEGLPQHEVIRRALSVHSFVQRASDGPSFHTTGSFANLFLDAMHKTLRTAYDEAPSTYQRWVRQAASASDFKTLYRIVFGEIGIPDTVPENGVYPEMTASDAKESYRVEKHGGIFSISMEMMVNDDLDAMTRIPRMQGNAMRRKINRDAYSTLVDNNALADGIALFHASSHGANLDSNALAESALDTGYTVMMTQAGLNSTTVLNIMPRFLIVPAALAATAYRITGGNVVPQTVGNVPLYGNGGERPLEVVVDGQIDSLGSTTNWWLSADNNVIDTVEITFLQGEETPALDREDGFTTDTIKYKIRQSYGIKPIDYRGLYQGNS